MHNIIDNKAEEREWMLIITITLSLLTFKKIKKLERYKSKLKGNFKYF